MTGDHCGKHVLHAMPHHRHDKTKKIASKNNKYCNKHVKSADFMVN